MKYPNFSEEKKLWKAGFKNIAGLDEAGRGPLAGPVVAAAVNLKFEIYNLKSVLNNKNFKILRGIKDSKKLSAKQREFFYNILTKHKDIEWGVGIVSEKIIDKINILEATKLAMKKAIFSLSCKVSDRTFYKKIGFLLIDGNFALRFTRGKKYIPEKSIIKGDEKVFSISAASIIAKVTRDRIMKKYHKKYPVYNFVQNKGYPTKAHFASLKKFGPCDIHRLTFACKSKKR